MGLPYGWSQEGAQFQAGVSHDEDSKGLQDGVLAEKPLDLPPAISTAGSHPAGLGTLGSFTAPCKPPATPPALLQGNQRNYPKFPHLQLPGETLFVVEQDVKSTAAPFSTLKTAEQRW